MLKLLVVVASTREERVGHLVADWAVGQVRAHGKFQSELADLKAIDLPLLDEPNHPRLGQYKHAHTKAWSATVSAADAFLFVTPEYNFAMAPAMLNALDYLFREWAYKPAAFVSYGGMSGGTRSVQSAKPFVTKFVKDGRFEGDENQAKSAVAMLDELHKWAAALAPLRAPAS
ncbi:MAG: NAD(P)H-dependent oxidoreductase [Pseudomonadota bacterium]